MAGDGEDGMFNSWCRPIDYRDSVNILTLHFPESRITGRWLDVQSVNRTSCGKLPNTHVKFRTQKQHLKPSAGEAERRGS